MEKKIRASMSCSYDSSGGAFPNGYCVYELSGGADPLLQECKCKDGFQCDPPVGDSAKAAYFGQIIRTECKLSR